MRLAHVRRKFVDIHRSQGSPLAEEAIGRIAQLYAVEKEARRSSPDRRTELRRAHAAPVFDDLERWLAMQLTTISGQSPLAAAIRYTLNRMDRLRPYLDLGILELDNNAVERGMPAIALGRKNYLFVGSEAGGKAAAIAYTRIETAKINAVDPHSWLADILARIPDYKITKVDDLIPWRWNAERSGRTVTEMRPFLRFGRTSISGDAILKSVVDDALGEFDFIISQLGKFAVPASSP